jgi:hypothetical protein
MKAFILIAIVIVCIVSCKKGNDVSPNVSPAFFGKWEVKRTYGGFIIPPDSVYKPGNGNILQLNSDFTYIHYVNNIQNAQGMYHIVKNGYMLNQTTYDEIYFDNDTSFKSVISLNNDILTIRPLIPDIGTMDYQKISN